MESVEYDTYLGDIVSGDGRNTRNLKKRVTKGIGIITQIMNLLDSISLGEFYIKIALLLRESMFINGVITNAEIWYSLTKEEIKELEDMDKSLLRRILKVPFSTPGEAYHLELGVIPIGVIIKARRINYFYYLLTRNDNEMLSTFFKTQWYNEIEGDWTKQLKIDLDEFGLPCDFSYYKSKSKNSFKSLVKIKAKEVALRQLKEKQELHSKMNGLYYSELKLQDYFKIPGIKKKELQNLFKWRVRMAPLGENFRGKTVNKVCPMCHIHLDNQSTIFKCETLKKEIEIECEVKDIYCDKITLKTARKITEIEETREKILKK